MENKKLLMFGILFVFAIFSVVIFSGKLSAAEAIVCCEKTIDSNPNQAGNQPAWCLEVSDVNNCDTSGDLRNAPTSCESTSYCKVGTCVNTLEGLCMENVPQKVCEDTQATGGIAAGVWYDSVSDELNQCQLGCCLIGDQAAFTTQTRCKQLSSEYGLETNYRSDIQSETQCVRSATPNVNGACVFEEEFQRTCRFVTREECQNLENSGTEGVEFNAGFLCSASQLGTNCGPSEQTTILDGKDEVYFIDTCGNSANIYDASRQDEADCTSGSSSTCGYWERIVPNGLSCGIGNSNAESEICGNCNYYLGSTGKLYERSRDGNPPEFGDYICVDLSCGNEDGAERNHGETWCVSSAKSDSLKNNPGSRDFRKVCYNGEVTTEPCADFRQELCIEDSIGDFSTAACRPNLWQDCVATDNKKDCKNTDRRDCAWVPGERFDGQVRNNLEEDGKCVPASSPGYDFWNSESDAVSLCAQGKAKCQAKFEKGLSSSILSGAAKIVGGADSDWKCVGNCECVGLVKGDGVSLINTGSGNNWVVKHNEMCIALGDCGVNVNSQNKNGYYDLEDLASWSDVAASSSGGGLFG